jgi:hypothetical protein
VIEQIVIAVFGTLAVWLSQSPEISARRWAPWLGLAAQPAWLYASFKAEQYGITFLAGIYTAAWIRGIRTYWRKA